MHSNNQPEMNHRFKTLQALFFFCIYEANLKCLQVTFYQKDLVLLMK